VKRPRTRAAVLLAAALLLAYPVQVMAAQAAAPAPIPSMSAQLWPAESDGVILIVSVTVPTDTPLPCVVRLPLPSGATVGWAGEIIGPTPDKDIGREYTIVDGTGAKVVEFTLKTSRTGQYDASYTAATRDGDVLVATLDWVQSAASSSLELGVKTPASVTEVTVTPKPARAPQFNDDGERLYLLDPVTLPLGGVSTVSVRFAPGGTKAPVSAGGPNNALLVVLGLLLVCAIVALVWQVRLQRARPGA
jgi:hypothetical protein